MDEPSHLRVSTRSTQKQRVTTSLSVPHRHVFERGWPAGAVLRKLCLQAPRLKREKQLKLYERPLCFLLHAVNTGQSSKAGALLPGVQELLVQVRMEPL